MEKERKASEVILELESKLDKALDFLRNQDLMIKILNNKLTAIADTLDKKQAEPPKFTVEAINVTTQKVPVPIPMPGPLSEREVAISAEAKLPVEVAPQGFRRTSRPETFSGDDAYLSHTKYPTQIPKAPGTQLPPPGRTMGEAVVPDKASKKLDISSVPTSQQPSKSIAQNAVPVTQRVVNGHGKSLFLADVEVINKTSMETVTKTRCNGTGKWMASLALGEYKVIIRKLDATTKERLEVSQDVLVDGSQSPLELQTVIVK